jgi:predicted dinucleotide-binding enzyme
MKYAIVGSGKIGTALARTYFGNFAVIGSAGLHDQLRTR